MYAEAHLTSSQKLFRTMTPFMLPGLILSEYQVRHVVHGAVTHLSHQKSSLDPVDEERV